MLHCNAALCISFRRNNKDVLETKYSNTNQLKSKPTVTARKNIQLDSNSAGTL